MESDHRARESCGISCQRESELIGSALSVAGPSQLEGTEGQRDEAEDDDEEWQARRVPGGPYSEP